MSKRRGWDWEVLELLREWRTRPFPADFPVGAGVLHKPTRRWFLFGELCQDLLIAVDEQGEPVVLSTAECGPGWLPESDPQKFEAELQQRRRARG